MRNRPLLLKPTHLRKEISVLSFELHILNQSKPTKVYKQLAAGV
jgi:hypothetical protein